MKRHLKILFYLYRQIYFDYSCMWHVSFKITLYYIREKQNRKEFLVMVLGNVFLLLSTYVCRSVRREDGIRKRRSSELYIFICKRVKKPRIKSHLPSLSRSARPSAPDDTFTATESHRRARYHVLSSILLMHR
jgi:hypothetical protein